MSNEQAISILKPMMNMMRDQHGCPISDACFALDKAVAALSEADSKRGKWKGYNMDECWVRDDETPIFLVCDKCNGVVLNNGSAHWNFCPNCGTRMVSEDERSN